MLYIAAIRLLLLILSNDIETNPGPPVTDLNRFCRACKSEKIIEKNWLRVDYFTQNYANELAMAFHHGEDLKDDNVT